MPVIEISFTEDKDEMPEHYGYYDNFEDAKEALDGLAKEFGEEE